MQNLKCVDFGKNDHFNPIHYNLPSCMAFPYAVLKQISLKCTYFCA